MQEKIRNRDIPPGGDDRRRARTIVGGADVLLSPMAGISDRPFRSLCREFGADVVYCEFVSADGVLHGNPSTFNLMEIGPDEHPIGIQLFGSDPGILARAARTAERVGPDLIDLNFGCPVKKVVKRNGGSALLCDLPLMERIVRAVVETVSLPVTAKIRLGWSRGSVNYLETTRMLEEAGVTAVTVHGRTRDQGFGGVADWEPIARIREAVSVPVVANGDVWNARDYLDCRRQTGCRGVMLARGAIGNPWIFAEIRAALDGREWSPPPVREVVRVLEDHLDRARTLHGERMGVLRMRRQMAAYLKGFPGASALRRELFTRTDRAGVTGVLHAFLKDLGPRADLPVTRPPSPREAVGVDV